MFRCILHLVYITTLLTGMPISVPRVSSTPKAGLLVTAVDDSGDTNPGDGMCTTAGGGCTLRAAIEEANAWAGADSIMFNLPIPVTITLGSALPSISQELTIFGPEATALAISGNHTVRVFTVSSSATLTLQNLTIANGKSSPGGYGGGLFNMGGTVIITRSIFSDNQASHGGAIQNDAGTLTIADSIFLNNTAETGGGIGNYGGAEYITGTVFMSNTASSGCACGGGINNVGGLVVLTNNTFSGNSANLGGGVESNDDVAGASVTIITNVTFSGNGASTGGAVDNGIGTLTLRNSIFANSPSGGNCNGFLTSTLNILSDDGTCGASSGNMPNLGALTYNGGPTPTHALLPGSQAINAGDTTTCAIASPNGPGGFDQRGVAHVGICDIGSFEFRDLTTTTLTTSINPSAYGQPVTFTATVSATVPGTPTGSVSFYDGTSLLGDAPLGGTLQVSLTTSSLTFGAPHIVVATYNGDTNFEISRSDPLMQVVIAPYHLFLPLTRH